MGSPTDEFFTGLEDRAPELLPTTARGTIRFDLDEDGHTGYWFVAINRGNVLVSRENREADCVVRTKKSLFDEFASGAAHILSAFNRNDVTVQGSLPLLLTFRRVFPSPPGTRDPRERVRARLGVRTGPGRRLRTGRPGRLERQETQQ
jgi:SCP-2 sterol transfer family.